MRLRFIALAALAAAFVPAAALGTGSGTVELDATLAGKNEVPKGDPKATGKAAVTLDAAAGKVCWQFTLTGVKGPNAAHIHKGAPGTAGGVVVAFGTAYKSKGCTSAPKSVVAAIIAKPAAYYVNVHTSKYPAGAVRGQLSKSSGAAYMY